MSVDRASQFPVRTALSGPAAGAVGAAGAGAMSNLGDLITLDIGGTSTDVCLIQNGRTAIASTRDISGFRIRLPMVAIHTVGAGGAETVTVADCDAEPPVPVQVSVNFVVAVRAGVACEPAVASEPLQPPEAVQAVALVDDQVSVALWPTVMEVGTTAMVTVGVAAVTASTAVAFALPPAPVQVST